VLGLGLGVLRDDGALCVQVPPYGNDTVFASMYLALESLSPKLREVLAPLKAVHSAFKHVHKDADVSDSDSDLVSLRKLGGVM
jgi:alpha-ketoglutarate-dependent taurine dioxygenase